MRTKKKKVGFYTLQRHPFLMWFANEGGIQSFQQLKSKSFFCLSVSVTGMIQTSQGFTVPSQ